ncbi:MAG: IreB family regulatory phosphoprotein [Oscillospiraceae bacterium]|nr:IreB family regulatory phosphoprotein [Oscillospiraceae bacterium]
MRQTTKIVNIGNNNSEFMQETLSGIYRALKERGYDPLGQIAGYVLSEDPTYITTHGGARALAQKLDRDELLKAMLQVYLNHKE